MIRPLCLKGEALLSVSPILIYGGHRYEYRDK
jgi:hypothetical protein